jgi:hypothetical protein
MTAQRGRCPICQVEDQFFSKASTLYVDRDPETEEIVGLLCNECGTGLDSFGRDPTFTARATLYLHDQGAKDD